MNIMSVAASAGGDHGPPPPSFWAAWPWEPHLLLAIAAGAGLYALGYARLRRRSPRAYPGWRAWCFAGGLLAIALAVVSPIAVYSERAFFVHMIQHLLMLLIGPPLLLLGAPLLPALWGLPPDARRRIAKGLKPGGAIARLGDALVRPWFAVAAYVTTIAVWHLPTFYDQAQGRTLIHDLQHLMFLSTALLFWWPVIHPSGGRRRLSYGAAIPYLLPPFLEGMVIGIVLTFADGPIYRTYAEMEPIWGLSALDDQQLGGLIMWVPGSMLFMIPLIGLLVMILRQEERNAAAAPVRSDAGGSRV